MKLELVRRLAGTRYQLAGVIGDAKEFFSALNEAFVVFYDCPKVLQAIDQLKQRLHEPDSLDETIPALFRVLLDSLGMRSTEVSDEFIMHPFTLNPTAKRSQIGTVKGKQAEPVRPDNVG